MDQVVQIVASLLVLTAFVGAQRGWLATHSLLYISLNLIGAGVLAVIAAYERQLGFLLLEACWALVAGHALVLAGRHQRDVVRRRATAARTPR